MGTSEMQSSERVGTALAIFVFVIGGMGVASSMAWGQGLLGGDRKLAIGHLTEFAEAAQNLPDSFAVTMRSSRIVAYKSRKHHERDLICLYAKDDPSKSRYTAHGFSDDRGNGFGNLPQVWEQKLEYDGQRYFRAGHPLGDRAFRKNESADIPSQDSAIRPSMKDHHPIYYSVARSQDLSTGMVDHNYALHLLEHLDLESTKRDDRGNLHSHWKMNKLMMSFEFNSLMGNRPSRVTLRGLEDQDGNRPLLFLASIRWERLGLDDGNSTWVPVFSQSVEVMHDRQVEVVNSFAWKRTEGLQCIPQPEDEDWREPMRWSFDANWREVFDADRAIAQFAP